MPRKGFRRVTPDQARAATIRNLRHLRDEALRFAKNATIDGDVEAAFECLARAQDYDRRTETMGRGETPSVNRSALPE